MQEFGNRGSEYGWEIDHIIPVAAGGTDNIHNLQALHWKVNEEKGDQHPWP
ncbi:MAG: HNH endonuclease [Chitinophagales bacterium]|nr:HNH endonuclease [Chitinophagales bacterium]